MDEEPGFTLIETVIATMIIGIVVATIAGALILLYSTMESTTERLSESPDLQIAAAYFGSDVQSAEAFDQTCGTVPVGATRIADFSWTDPGAAPTSADDRALAISYAVVPEGTQKQLVRYSCVPPAAVDEVTVVHYLDPTTNPAIECADAAGIVEPCSAGTSSTVRLPLTICTADTSGVCKDDPFSFELKATRRKVG